MARRLAILAAATTMLVTLLAAIAAAEPSGAKLEFFASGLDDEVMAIAFAPGDDRMFIVERAGLIKVIQPDGTVLPTPVLDIRSAVFSINGLVFHPDFQTNRLFYTYAIEDGKTRILEYEMSAADPNVADPSSRRLVLERQRDSNFHAGGQMEFGPDGYLYMSLGDGGQPPGDPWENGQDITTIDASIIRIDHATGQGAPDNPFVDGAGDDAIWIYGLRHPWRFSFDEATGLMYVADVGSGTYEEVNIVAPDQGGDNFGWDVMEGTNCYEEPEGNEAPCGDPSYILPTYQYSHAVGCSIIGGYVYHGLQVPQMQNQYFYSDYCEGWIKSFEYVDGQITNEQDWTGLLGSVPLVTTWGQDNAGELSLAVNGTIYKIVPDGPPPEVGTIAGTVWADDDLDGLQGGEAGVAGVSVELWVDSNDDGAADLQLDATTTNGAGNYQFPSLAITSTYVIRFDAPVGKDLTLRDVGSDDAIDSDPDPQTGFTAPITLDAGEVDATIDAGLVPAPVGVISGRIWNDLDGDGLQGGGEPGFPGLFAWLYTDDDFNGNPDTKIDAVAVDANGEYLFNVDPAFSYFLLYGQQIFINGQLTLNLPNRTTRSPRDVGADDTIDSDADEVTGFAGPITVSDGETIDAVDAGFVPLPASYAETIADDGATGHWRLGEATGTTAFDAAGSAHATYVGDPGLDAAPLIVDEDQAVHFDGSDDGVHLVNSPAMNQGGPYATKSVELWFRADDVLRRQVLIEQGSVTRGLNVYLQGGQLFGGMYNTDTFQGGTPWGPVFLSTPVAAGTTHHVVLVLDQPQDTLRLYMNGELAASAGGVGLLYNHGLSAVAKQRDWARYVNGASQGEINHFAGTIDEVAIYPSALDAFTVADHYATGSEGATTNPTAEIVAPPGGSVVAGTTTIGVAATDDDPIGSLIVEISTNGGASWHSAGWSPGSFRYEYQWDTTSEADGPVTIEARATDSDGNVGIAAPVAVTVDNGSGPGYRDVVIGDGATILWRLGEVAGTTAFDEVGTNDAPYLGAPALGAAALISDPDPAVAFDGIDDTIRLVNSPEINQGGPYLTKSIELWFNAADVATRQVLIEQGSVTRGLVMYLLNGQLWAGIYNADTYGGGTPWGPVFLSTPVAANSTYHAVIVFDAPSDLFSLYVNGALADSGTGLGALQNHGRSAIGSQWDWTRFHDGGRFGDQHYFAGRIDEVAMYAAALSVPTIAAHHAAGTAAGPVVPTVTIDAPTVGSAVSGTTLVVVTAEDDDPVGSLLVEVSTDGGATWMTAPWSSASSRYEYAWDTTAHPDGPAVIEARATDSDGNTTTASPVGVTVDNATTGYRDIVLADGATIYWRLGEATGSMVIDELGNNDNTYLGDPTLGAGPLIADIDSAVDFDGVDDTVRLVNSPELNQGGPYTTKSIELWFSADDVAGRQVLLEQGSVSRGLNIYLIGGQLWAGIYNTSTFQGGVPWGPVFLSSPVTAGTTYHVAIVFDVPGDAFSLYVNGELAETASGIGALYNHGRAAIGSEWDWARFHDGARFGNQYYFDGTLDEIAVYGDALAATTIAHHYAAGR